ncbi:DUF6245 family protein [Planobispora siamensis]|uniref:Uncharacterized protein n=1 Tax=Planobispora siamensis TaxID=936338 RepID=A0A8J3SMX2_9ACTN|nr:DUF6245 family protein [Planobispora siamensis]GIH95259.1 hypothetical protein Psi01_58890 [Planobispora siamensis]
MPAEHSDDAPALTPEAVAAALAALGSYAYVPTSQDLARDAATVGGEHVLAALLANALYGAAVATAMAAETRMVQRGATAEQVTLARRQVMKAAGAVGPGVVTVLHWQMAQVAGPLYGWSQHKTLGPLGEAMAQAASALVLLLEVTTATGDDDARLADLNDQVRQALRRLEDSHSRLRELLASGDGLARVAEAWRGDQG